MDEFDSFAARNTGLVKLAPSHLERHTDAIWIAYEDTRSSPWTEMARRMRGEIAHLHGHGDFSGHVTLSPADCKFWFYLLPDIMLSFLVSYDSLHLYLQLQARKSSNQAGASDMLFLGRG